MRKREGIKFVSNIPNEYGKAVSMIVWNDTVYIACEYAIFYLDKKTKELVLCKFRGEK